MVSAGIGVAIFPSHSLTNLDGIFSKELIFSDNTRLEQTKIIAYKESMKQKYSKVLNESF